jgi:hypothetical protein
MQTDIMAGQATPPDSRAAGVALGSTDSGALADCRQIVEGGIDDPDEQVMFTLDLDKHRIGRGGGPDFVVDALEFGRRPPAGGALARSTAQREQEEIRCTNAVHQRQPISP